MQTVTMELPEGFSALRRSPGNYRRGKCGLRLPCSRHSRGMISQEKVARNRGNKPCRVLAAGAQNKIDVFAVDFR